MDLPLFPIQLLGIPRLWGNPHLSVGIFDTWLVASGRISMYQNVQHITVSILQVPPAPVGPTGRQPEIHKFDWFKGKNWIKNQGFPYQISGFPMLSCNIFLQPICWSAYHGESGEITIHLIHSPEKFDETLGSFPVKMIIFQWGRTVRSLWFAQINYISL